MISLRFAHKVLPEDRSRSDAESSANRGEGNVNDSVVYAGEIERRPAAMASFTPGHGVPAGGGGWIVSITAKGA